MKIEVRGSELEECVDDLKKIIDAAPGEMVTLSAEADGTEKGRVTVRRIDGGNMAELKVDARVLESGAVTVRFQELTQACAPFFRDKSSPSKVARRAFRSRTTTTSAPPFPSCRRRRRGRHSARATSSRCCRLWTMLGARTSPIAARFAGSSSRSTPT